MKAVRTVIASNETVRIAEHARKRNGRKEGKDGWTESQDILDSLE